MPRTRHRLTPEVEQTLLTYVRAGGFPDVAAAAAGVPAEVFARWLRKGRGPGARRYRDFREAVLQAAAQARMAAEVQVFQKRPLDWLRCGPGRAAADSPGWTATVKAPAAGPGRAADLLMLPEVQRLFQFVLDQLAPYPDARTAVAGALAEQGAASRA
ncbi:MAG TPA: hypothetical protein VFE78_32850 [Gemmataceae bacterium]|jgi:hypothetical protein|nr:hypothetical protein [Gemmataceae bacterium]